MVDFIPPEKITTGPAATDKQYNPWEIGRLYICHSFSSVPLHTGFKIKIKVSTNLCMNTVFRTKLQDTDLHKQGKHAVF